MKLQRWQPGQPLGQVRQYRLGPHPPHVPRIVGWRKFFIATGAVFASPELLQLGFHRQVCHEGRRFVIKFFRWAVTLPSTSSGGLLLRRQVQFCRVVPTPSNSVLSGRDYTAKFSFVGLPLLRPDLQGWVTTPPSRSPSFGLVLLCQDHGVRGHR